MFKLIKKARRKPAAWNEETPQLTIHQRRALELVGTPPANLSYATYRSMGADSMVQTALTIKRLAVQAGEWQITPADGSADASLRAEFVRMALARMEGSADSILQQAMDAFAYGWSVQELVLEPSDGLIWLRAVRPKDPALFGLSVDEFGRVEGLTLQLPGDQPLKLPREKFVLYLNRPSYRKTKGQSDLDAAYPHWLAKQSLLKAWKLHLERFASPTVLGKYERGLPAEEQSSILRALQSLQDTLAIVYPSEIEIETLGGDRAPSPAFQEAIEFHNREIGRSILGQTLTTDEGRKVGSLALGKVHLQVLMMQVAAIRKDLADRVMTEQVIRPMVELNFGPGRLPRFEFSPSKFEVFDLKS